jgi:site-specific DNA-methyltransferase (adenine-specific)
MLALNEVHQGDCLDLLPLIPDASVDMILCDLPYGITACDWDKVIDLDRLWEQYKRIVKPKAAIVLTGSQPFTTDLINSNREWFKYEWIWDKKLSSGALNANRVPLKRHENVTVFYLSCKYNPIMRKGGRRIKGGGKPSQCYGSVVPSKSINDHYYPTSLIEISNACHNDRIHSTQKPVKLFEYLIRTYTDEGDLVLDNCIGSGTTAVAALNTGRNFIGIELSEEYCEIARNRIARETRQERLKL